MAGERPVTGAFGPFRDDVGFTGKNLFGGKSDKIVTQIGVMIESAEDIIVQNKLRIGEDPYFSSEEDAELSAEFSEDEISSYYNQ